MLLVVTLTVVSLTLNSCYPSLGPRQADPVDTVQRYPGMAADRFVHVVRGKSLCSLKDNVVIERVF